MADGYSVDTTVLRRVSEDLRTRADQMRPRYVDGHQVDVGCSTGEVGEALRHLGKAGGDLSELCRLLAEQLRHSAEVYDQAEATNNAEAERLDRHGRLP